MNWIRSRIGNGPSRKAHGPFPQDLTFFKTDITYDTNLRHTQYIEVTRILCIWSWLSLNLQRKEMV